MYVAMMALKALLAAAHPQHQQCYLTTIFVALMEHKVFVVDQQCFLVPMFAVKMEIKEANVVVLLFYK